jgi:RNase P subunit RPR2
VTRRTEFTVSEVSHNNDNNTGPVPCTSTQLNVPGICSGEFVHHKIYWRNIPIISTDIKFAKACLESDQSSATTEGSVFSPTSNFALSKQFYPGTNEAQQRYIIVEVALLEHLISRVSCDHCHKRVTTAKLRRPLNGNIRVIWICRTCDRKAGARRRGEQDLTRASGKFCNVALDLSCAALLSGVRVEPMQEMFQLMGLQAPSTQSLSSYIDTVCFKSEFQLSLADCSNNL